MNANPRRNPRAAEGFFCSGGIQRELMDQQRAIEIAARREPVIGVPASISAPRTPAQVTFVDAEPPLCRGHRQGQRRFLEEGGLDFHHKTLDPATCRSHRVILQVFVQ
jgi:hypothetical protein